MSHSDVKPQHRTYARKMRTSMTDAELKLWNALRAHRLEGLSFRRQLPILGYIVDFACPAHKLIIELDGMQHGEDLAIEYDRERADALKQHGWTTLRFWNNDILTDIDNVCLHILRTISEVRS